MALTSALTKTVNAPHEPGTTVTIRKLSHHHLMMAEDARFDRSAQKARAIDGITLPDSDAETKAKAQAEAEKPENKYDRSTVLRYGVVAWSYEVLPDEEQVNDLDEETAAWLFSEIITFSVRSAADVKASANGSQPSSDLAEAVGQSS